MDNAHKRISSVYCRVHSFCKEGHATYLCLKSRHLKILLEQDTQIVIKASKSDIENILHGKLLSMKVWKIPNDQRSSGELDHVMKVIIDPDDDEIQIPMGPAKGQIVNLEEDVIYVRTIRAMETSSVPVELPANQGKLKGKKQKRITKNDESQESGPEVLTENE